MKKLLVLFLLVSANTFSQQQELFVEKIDGTKVKINSAKINGDNKKIIFKVVGETKETKAKYEEIKMVSYAGYIFRIVKDGNGYDGFFINSESDEYYLGFRRFDKIANRGGGFESTFEHVDIAVIDKQGNIVERFDLRETNNKKNKETRMRTYEAIKKYFSDCPKLTAMVTEYQQQDRLRDYFSRPDFRIECK